MRRAEVAASLLPHNPARVSDKSVLCTLHRELSVSRLRGNSRDTILNYSLFNASNTLFQ